ncbi:MAG: Ig-like domain-containing protein [Bacillota bacterium]
MRRSRTLTGLFTASLLALLGFGCGGGYSGSSYTTGGGGGTGNIVSIVISPATASVTVGGMQQYTAVSRDASGHVVTGAALNWASSNTAVATVNSSGLATSKAVGSTGITASITYSGGIYGMPVTYTSNTGTLTVTTMDSVMGTVAVGHALAGAFITLEDAQGRRVSALSGADGHFQLSVAGLDAPFLLKADDGRGRVMYGAALQAGNANIDPLSDLVLRAAYDARGADIAAAFAAHAAPDGRALASVDAALTTLLADTLQSQGLQADKFSLLSTPFNADGSGFDRVLDNTVVNTAAGRLDMQDGLSRRDTEIASTGGELTLSTRDLDAPGVTGVRRVALP